MKKKHKNPPQEFVDRSGDKEFFTVIPNLIVNGYSAVMSGVYLYIKKRAGEKGKFFEPAAKTAKKLKISKPTYLAIRKKLIKEGRIKFAGWKPSKTHPIKVFEVVDIWRENIQHYKKGKGENVSSSKEKRKVKEKTLERSIRDTQKKNQYRRRTNINNQRKADYRGKKKVVDNSPRSKSKFKKLDELLGQKKIGGIHEWQDAAARFAKSLGFKPSRSWFKFFRDNYQYKKGVISTTYSQVSDVSMENPEKYFYKVFYINLKAGV